MTRVEWAALGGDEVETVVSMLIFNEHPRATRIRPSQGDYGIDLLTPHPEDATHSDVWQIKKFAANLVESQKGQIEKSFRRVLIALVRRGVRLADWYLVMPLDPTLENALDWFNAMPERVIAEMFADAELALTEDERARIKDWRETPGRVIDWKGLTYCEGLVAKYWYVPDYYLHGGSQRIRDAVAEVGKILQRDLTLPNSDDAAKSSILEPSELREHLARAGRALDGDPHFRYGVSIDPVAPQLLPEPSLIAATQEVAPDGMCLTFRVYTRFDEAVNERQIPINVRFQFEPGSTEQQAFEDWRKYGKLWTTDAAVDLDLPGGLGGSFESGTATISPTEEQTGEVRYRIVTPNEEIISELHFLTAATSGVEGTGLYVRGRDMSGLVSLEAHLDMTDRSGKVAFSSADPTGHEAVDIRSATAFLAGLCHPNRLQIAQKHGPFHDYDVIPNTGSQLPLFVARYINALAELQPYTATPILVPDLQLVTGALAQRVFTAARLLDGQTIVGTWNTFEFESNSDASITSGGHYQVATIEPLTVDTGQQTITLGATENTLLSARLTSLGNGSIRVEPHLNNTGHQIFAPNEPVPSTGRSPVRSRPAPDPAEPRLDENLPPS